MPLFYQTRVKIGRYFLSKRLKKHQRNAAFKNFKHAKNLGLIFKATDLNHFQTIQKYAQSLMQKGLEVSIVGFVDVKKTPEFLNQAKVPVTLITPKDLNWYYKPKNTDIQNFIDKKLDILIDLNLSIDFPLEYILALSKADFKVGCAKSINTHYDFMIDLGTTPNVEALTQEIDKYLEMIK